MYQLLIANRDKNEIECQNDFLRASKLEIESIHLCQDMSEFDSAMEKFNPEILIIDRDFFSFPEEDSISRIQQISQKHKIILTIKINSLENILKAFRGGVIEVLTFPLEKESYCTAINKAIDLLDEEKRQKQVSALNQKVQTMLERHILKDLESGFCDQEYFRMLGLNRICGCCYYLKAEQEILPYRDIVENVLRTSFNEFNYKCVFSVGNTFIHLILFINKEPERYAMCNNMETFITRLFEALNIEFTLGTGAWFDTIEEIVNAFSCAKQIAAGQTNRNAVENNGSALNNSSPEEVEKITEYIKNHYREHLTLESIAQSVGFSKSYISRQFKQYKGITIMDYVIRKRIEKAKILLREGDWSIKQISYYLGYSDPNYFSWSFKKQVGIYPMQYRYNGLE